MRSVHPYIALAKRFFTFGSGSLVGAIIDYVVTLLLVEFAELPASVALALAMALSATVVFFFHETITFAGPKASHPRMRYLRFMLLAALVLALRVIALYAFTAAGLPVSMALIIVIVLVSVFNFAASSILVFLKGDR